VAANLQAFDMRERQLEENRKVKHSKKFIRHRDASVANHFQALHE
jgi:hypothetical protein